MSHIWYIKLKINQYRSPRDVVLKVYGNDKLDGNILTIEKVVNIVREKLARKLYDL